MSGSGTTRLLDAYREEAMAPMFLASRFRTPPQNFHRSELVEIDVVRSDPHIAIPVQSVSSGARKHESSKYTNKGFIPPVYDLEASITAYNKMKRQPGQDPFQDPNFLSAAVDEAFRHLRELENLIRRAVELQCAQVLQTGIVSLKDAAGVILYTLDFKMKASHKVTVGTEWSIDGSTGAPLADLESLADVVRRDGKREPNLLYFGSTAIQRFLANADVQARLDNRRMTLGEVAPSDRGTGATFHGFIWVGSYRFEMWTYKETFIDPQTSAHVPYIDTDKVIMLSEGARYDLTYGELPMFLPPDARVQQFLPSSMNFADIGLGLTTNAWTSPDGKHLMLSAGTRPLAIPTAIDTIGVLDVVP